MSKENRLPKEIAAQLGWPLRLTLWGMGAEALVRAFWPLWSLVCVGFTAAMFGAHEALGAGALWGALGVWALAALAALIWGARRFAWPRRAEALARIDAHLPGRPIVTLQDTQAVGAADPASQAVWAAHLARMQARAAQARADAPDLTLSSRDPFALRYMALLGLFMALLFGAFWRVGGVADALDPGGGADALARGPTWEGWIEPPAYTGKPTLYLADQGARLSIPEGSRLTLRLYGEVGALSVEESISGRDAAGPSGDVAQDFTALSDGELAILGAPGGEARWHVSIIEDTAPSITIDAEAERGAGGEMHVEFSAADDYAVTGGQARITLDLAAVDRRFGRVVDPEPREAIVIDLPMPISGSRAAFSEVLIEDLSRHPWAGLPVALTLSVRDGGGNEGATPPAQMPLPGRRFFDPLAAAVAGERAALLWNRENARRVTQVLRAVSHRPEDVFRSETAYLKLRMVIRRLETNLRFLDQLPDDLIEESAQALWDIAVLIEEGNLADARERLRRAQDRLAEAMRNGASDAEIAELMDELREAMDDYMRQLAQEAQESDGQEQAQNDQDRETISGDQLQQMLDRLQQLMEEGRMAEAEQLLEQLRQMMENMQVTQGEGQEGQQSPGQQALGELGDTLREQQGLNDDTFSDLQEQFGQDGQQGQPGQQGQQGQQMPGQGQPGQSGPEGPGTEGQPGTQQGTDLGQSLAGRQQALRNELDRQLGALPEGMGEEGSTGREALDRAGRAMDRAEGALRDGNLAEALDGQSEALEALREGMRELSRDLAQAQSDQSGEQGEAMGRASGNQRTDPLGRDQGGTGQLGDDVEMMQGEDVYRRARDLLDEIRRRSADQTRPEVERDYLRRLLDRF